MVATVRLINCGLLDELPTLKILVSHFGGCIGRYLPRIRGLQDREQNGTSSVPGHCRQPLHSFDYYLEHRLFYDCCGWSSADDAAKEGADWVRRGLTEVSAGQLVFATDYPQAVQDDNEVASYIKAVRGLGREALSVLHGDNVEKLIPNISERRDRYAAGAKPLQQAGPIARSTLPSSR